MKCYKTLLSFIVVFSIIVSCQKELFFDGVSTGVLKKDAANSCSPIVANGVYHIDSIFSDKNFIEVAVEVVYAGSYTICSDTINGFYFKQSGDVKKGISTIRLQAIGKPMAMGNFYFTIHYGESSCKALIKTLGPQPAIFTLVGSPNICSGFFVDGNYTINLPLTASNIITVQTMVTVPGTYNVTATTTNGFSFSASGIFTATGLQNIVLKGIGTPINAEQTTVLVKNFSSNCNLYVEVKSDTAGKAIFSFDGSPNDCINYTINGNYYQSIATNLSNSVSMKVNVTKLGSYNINTNTAAGITFSKNGIFNTLGSQTVLLQSNGTPTAAALTSFIPNTGTVSCNFLLDIKPLPPPAQFTLNGSPNNCTAATVNGFYIVNKPLDGANTATIQVNVAAVGSYSISTNTINGISFLGTGVFANTGIQNVILQGIGVPINTGIFNVTPSVGATSCSYSVQVI